MNASLTLTLALLGLAGCAVTSEVMDTGNGTYMISAHAAPIRGGAAGANQIAYKDAKAFCAKDGKHPVILTAESRDVYQGSAGNTDLHFRCSE